MCIRDRQYVVPGEVLKFGIVSLQVEWSGGAGTLDGTVKILQSNGGSSFDAVGTAITIGTASGSATETITDFGGRFLGVLITKTGLTGGLLTLTVVVKTK